MPGKSDDTKEMMQILKDIRLLSILIFTASFFICAKANAETLPKTFFAWNCGPTGETVCATNDTKKVPGVFGVAKFHPDTLRPLVHSDTPKYKLYYFRGAYLPQVIVPKKEKYTLRRERRQMGDINKPVYVVYDEEGNEVAVSESGGRPLFIEPGNE